MDLKPSQPQALVHANSTSGIFGRTGLSLSKYDSASTAPGLPFETSFNNASPTEFGMQTNKSIVYHFSARSQNVDMFGPGALLFSLRNPRRFDVKCHDRCRYVFDIFDLNEWFIKMHTSVEMKTMYETHLGDADQVVREIGFAGVLKSSITAGARERNTGSCVMNNVVGERASAVNLWGQSVRECAPLYMLITRMDSKTASERGAWQMTPHAGCKPTSSMLAYNGFNNKKCIGAYIFIGTAISPPTCYADGNADLINDPVRSKRLSAYAGGLDVCIGV